MLHSFVSGFCGVTLTVSLIHTAVCAGSSFFMALYYSVVCADAIFLSMLLVQQASQAAQW